MAAAALRRLLVAVLWIVGVYETGSFTSSSIARINQKSWRVAQWGILNMSADDPSDAAPADAPEVKTKTKAKKKGTKKKATKKKAAKKKAAKKKTAKKKAAAKKTAKKSKAKAAKKSKAKSKAKKAEPMVSAVDEDMVLDEAEVVPPQAAPVVVEKPSPAVPVDQCADVGDQAFAVLMNLGLIQTSPDPQSTDYDSSKDDEIVDGTIYLDEDP